MHCKKLRMSKTSNGEIELTLVIDGYYNMRKAQEIFNELQNSETQVTIKQFKSSRSIEQNDMLWGIITQISDKVNGSHREEDLINIYSTLLQRANIKREYIRTLPQAVNILKQSFRAALEVPNSRKIENGKETVGFWVYYGSSNFNTKEMTELIDIALDLASELGVVYDG